MVEDYKSSRKSGFIFKIDFEKAYDHVEWLFLRRKKVLKKNGEDGLTDDYHRSLSRYLLMEDCRENSKDQED